jgi:hypothetical protein
MMKMKGPEAINRTVDFRVAKGLLLKRELISPRAETKSTQRTSLGTCLEANQVGVCRKSTIPVGNRQANKIEDCFMSGGQFLIASMEKTIMNNVERQKILKAQKSKWFFAASVFKGIRN